MAARKLSDAYKTIIDDPFPPRMEIAFVGTDGARTTLVYDKVLYEVEGERKGLRYGENPDQAAALYKPVGGNLALGGALLLEPGEGLVSAAELLEKRRPVQQSKRSAARISYFLVPSAGKQPAHLLLRRSRAKRYRRSLSRAT